MPKLSLKNILIIIASTIILLALLFLTFTFWQSQRPTSTLTVTGKASEEVIPDELSISFLVEKKGDVKDLEKLNIELDVQTNKILDYLKTQNIKSENIQTNKNSYNDYVYTPIRGEEGKPQDNVRNLSTQFIVKFVDYGSIEQKVNQIWQELLKIGVTNLNQNGFGISEAKKEDICENLQTKATQNAWEKAQKQLDGLGGGSVVKKQIRNGYNNCENNVYYPMMAKDSMSASSSGGSGSSAPAAPTVMAGKQKLEASVELQVDYR